MNIKLPRRRAWRIVIYVISTALILLAVDLVLVQLGRHITPGYDTTRITEPKLPDGEVDYLTAMESIRDKYPTGTHPLLLSKNKADRYMDIMLECARARLAAQGRLTSTN